MTDPTGRSFLIYGRARSGEAALLIQAQRDHGIPTWHDVENLGAESTEAEIRRVITDPLTANAVLFITPETEDSTFIRNVEVPLAIKRAESNDGFFALAIAAGGLSHEKAAEAMSNKLSAQDLTNWNMSRVSAKRLTKRHASELARRILRLRIRAVHASLDASEPLRIGFFVRRKPAFEQGATLTLDWSARFHAKETDTNTWNEQLLPALKSICDAVRTEAPGRRLVASGIPTLPAATALGTTFLSTGGIKLNWIQRAAGMSEQEWSVDETPVETPFSTDSVCKSSGARDIAVLVSIAEDVEPLVAALVRELPPLRALVHVRSQARIPYVIESPGHAVDIAIKVRNAIRNARREYGDIGVVHLFMAAPTGLAVLVGQLLNTIGCVQTYEHISPDGSGEYRRAATLFPCE